MQLESVPGRDFGPHKKAEMTQLWKSVAGEEIGDVKVAMLQRQRFNTAVSNGTTGGSQRGNDGSKQVCVPAPEVDGSYGTACCAIPERVSHPFTKGDDIRLAPIINVVQRKVEGSGPRTLVSLRPLFERVAPETPKVWGVGGDLKPMVTNEEEIVRALLQPAKVSCWGHVPTKDIPKYLGRHAGGYVQ